MRRHQILITVIVLAAFVLVAVPAIGAEVTAEEYFTRGKAYYGDQNYGLASQSFREAIRLNPNYVEAHYYMGLTLEGLGMNRQAIIEFKAVRELAPNRSQLTCQEPRADGTGVAKSKTGLVRHLASGLHRTHWARVTLETQ